MPSAYGRWVPNVGYADDASATVWAPGVGWVDADGYVYAPKTREVGALDGLKPDLRETALEYVNRAKKLYGGVAPAAPKPAPQPQGNPQVMISLGAPAAVSGQSGGVGGGQATTSRMAGPGPVAPFPKMSFSKMLGGR